MNFLERIQSAGDKKPLPVATPEWADADGNVYVRRLSAAERAALYDAIQERRATHGADFQAFLVAHCACLANGERCFEDGDWESLQSEPASVIERISGAADDLNAISDAARERVKKLRACPRLGQHLRIAREAGVSLKRLYEEWGDELPLWEAAHEIDPWTPARVDRAMWEVAKAVLSGRARSDDFDATRHAAAAQTAAQMAAAADRIAAGWPKHEKKTSDKQ